MKIDLKQKEKIIALYIFIVGILISVAVPVWQTPDEYTHLRMIGASLGREDFAENIYESIGIPHGRIEHNYDEKVDLGEYKNMLFRKPDYKRMDMLPHMIYPSVIKHFPAVIGILLGVLLGVPSYFALQLGELCCLLFYTIICYYSLKIMPLKKEVMAVIMLFPMSVHQAGSIGYDSVLLPLCFFLTAFVFYLKYEKDVVGLKDIAVLFSTWLIITYIKVPYVFLILLMLIIPLEKIDINLGFIRINENCIKKIRIPVCCIIVILGLVMVYLFRGNTHIQNVYGFIVEWRRGLYLLGETGRTWTEFLMISTVGNLGWLDTPMSFSSVLLVYVCLFIFALKRDDVDKHRKLKKWDVFILLGTMLLLCIFVTLSMVNHTIMVTLFGSEYVEGTYEIREAMYQIPYIGGVQGRYYLPFISLLFLAVPQKLYAGEKVVRTAFVILEAGIYIYIMCLLIQRYWIL